MLVELGCSGRWKTYEFFGKTIWSTSHVNKAVTLLTGRAWKQKASSSQMSFTEIGIVLEYLDIFHQQELKTEGQTMEEPSAVEDSQEPVPPAIATPDSYPNDETGWPSVVSPAGQL